MNLSTLTLQTRRSIFLSSLLFEPFASLYPLLPFILIHNYQVSPFHIVLLTMLKPIASIFSFYWSELLSQKKQTAKRNLLGAGLLARIPFIFAIFSDNPWILIGASTLYMLFMKASIPAWMEILKSNLPHRLRERYFAIGSALGYSEGILIAIGVGMLLDSRMEMWRILFLLALGLSLLGVIFQVILSTGSGERKELIKEKTSIKKSFLRPWLDCLELMRTRPDFRRFQWAFMIGGFGLMLIQPVIPFFFSHELHLSYSDLLIAYSICKGLGFVAASPLWSRLMSRVSIGIFTALVLLGFGIFPLLIILGGVSFYWIYFAYFIYGIAQAGSHLIWHLSGPIFAGVDKSSRFSSVGIVMSGIRGLLGPPLGGLLGVLSGPIAVLSMSAALSVGAILTMLIRVPKRLAELSE